MILDIHVNANWHLSKQGIDWLVSRELIARSGLEIIEVTCFFNIDRWPSAEYILELGPSFSQPVNLLPKFIVFLYKNAFHSLCFVLVWGYSGSKDKAKQNKHKTLPQLK